MDDLFGYENDDITDSLSIEDFQRLESEAWEKAEGLEKNVVNQNMKTKDSNIPSLELIFNPTVRGNAPKSNPGLTCQRPCLLAQTAATEQQASDNYVNKQIQSTNITELERQLNEYKLKVKTLEDSLCVKDGQLKLVTQSLDARDKEINEKINVIAKIRRELQEERSECGTGKLAQEVKKLKTQLSFQKHELMKLETSQIQSQKVSNSQNAMCNDQTMSHSQKVIGSRKGSVKRKAEIPNATHWSALDNSFCGSQVSVGKTPQGKVRRLERKNDHVGMVPVPSRPDTNTTNQHKETKSSNLCENGQSALGKPSTVNSVDKEDKVISLNASEELLCAQGKNVLPTIVQLSEKNPCNLIKQLVLSHACESSLNGDTHDVEPISLLTLLKYPLKHLPDVLKSHSVDSNPDQSLSQFPMWQTQVSSADSGDVSADEELDFDSGKYNLLSQGIFLLLGLSNLTERSVDTLGVIHVLVFLEVYITSYLLTRLRAGDKTNCKVQGYPRNCHQGEPEKVYPIDESEARRIVCDEQDMILQALHILKLLLYSTPGLVKCVLDRTDPSLFKKGSDEDVVVVYDSKSKGSLEECKQGNHFLSFQRKIGPVYMYVCN